ncbi:MAG: hypothetical protein RIR95_2012 [Pseudomonadota bacterium]|jgi:TetR/AcrR family transcriptional repressor of bet genes
MADQSNPTLGQSRSLAGPRKLSREARRIQLIEATVEVLAVRGFARVTLTEVAQRAGLSHGLVNFHFQSKDLLLTETLAYLSDEYRTHFTQALSQAGPSAAEQLFAMISADFSAHIATPPRLAAWVSFWGEAQSRPLYQARCGANDAGFIAQKEEMCAALIAQGGYDGDAVRIARVLRVTSEGVWMDMVTSANSYSPEEGLRTVLCAAAAFFPRHFSESGLIG